MGTFVAADASALTTSVTTLTGVTWPAHNVHDVAIVGWASDNTQTRTEPPTGFTAEFTNADGSLRAIVSSLDTTGSESGDVSLVCGGANRQTGVLALYRGYNPSITNITSQNETSGTAVTSHNSPSITPTDNGSAIVLIYMDRVSSSVVPTAPAGYTPRASFATGGSGGTTVVIADKLSGLTAGTPESPAAWTGGTASTAAYVIALELVPSATTQSATGDQTATATLAGAASGSKSASGDASASSALSGAASLAKSAVGTLAAVAALTGAATGVKPVLGDLAATVLATGAASVAKTSAGNVAATAAVTGASVAAKTASGDRSASATITGSASTAAVQTATGDRTSTVNLSGAAVTDHLSTGNRSASAVVGGAATIDQAAVGDRSTSVGLDGAATATRVAAGDVPVSATLTGEADVFQHFDPAARTTATARRPSSSSSVRAASTATARRPSATATVRSPA